MKFILSDFSSKYSVDFQEDNLIIKIVGEQGNKKWSEIAKHLPGRIGKQCRERSVNNFLAQLL